MQAKHYANIILSLGESKVDSVIAHLKKKGLIRLLPAILKEVERLTLKKNKIERATITSAKLLSEAELKTIQVEHSALLSKGDLSNVMDSSLIGGYRIQRGHHVIDASYKRELFDLYQKIKTT